ncbi:MAG: sigma-54-dependent transcriptional regulator [Fidelibacterota bacterium]
MATNTPSLSDPVDPGKYRVLVVDDEPDITRLFERYLSELGYTVLTATTSEKAGEIFSAHEIDVVLLDINMPRISGLKLLESFKELRPHTIVIMVSAIHDIDMVVKSIQMGAYDYLAKPIVDLNQIRIRINRAFAEYRVRQENEALRKELALQGGIPEIRSSSVAMKKVVDMIHTVAEYDTTVLLSGESGTGKEVAARTIHKYSRRSSGPFIAVNCGAIPETLLESTLFGHEKGAFTGATKRKAGLFEESNHGSIFLDEITETHPDFQVQLLRVMENNRIRRVGGTGEIELDLRIIAATNRDIEEMVEAGKFREDLYYRLNVFHIVMPPLRERQEDIPAIAEYELNRLAKKMDKKKPRLSPDVLHLFARYPWKGNIRELANVLENAIVMCRGDEITPAHLPEQFRSRGGLQEPSPGQGDGYRKAKENFERAYFADLLHRADGNISEAARLAGLSRQHLHLKIRELGIPH